MADNESNGNEQKWLKFLREGLKGDNSADSDYTTTSEPNTAKPPKQNGKAVPSKKPAFEPKDRSQLQQRSQLPDELWLAVLECPCTFPPDIFNTVMLNLIKNPNVTSTHLFRADIFYDTESDHLFSPENEADPYQGFSKHMKQDYRPRVATWPGLRLERTIVRQLIPRNPQVDQPLVQTCHLFKGQDGEEEKNLVLYIPHADKAEDVPFYHPTVSQLAFLHTWYPSVGIPESTTQPGTLTLLYRTFQSLPISSKLERTALKLLQTIHKHGQGQLIGYEKRVHHDQIIPQKRYQDTYTRLKSKYGRQISEKWVEVTDPGKHVFEDIGIAAFLIELWRDMYELPQSDDSTTTEAEKNGDATQKPSFPGFVDIGCGNGILVYLLLSEGYNGWGFDARERKTWSIFPPEVQAKLQQRILVPSIFEEIREPNPDWHDGTFPQGTFIVSNHADELTPWTPLLAHVNNSSFIAIPCCSHDLSGARFRAPATTRAQKETPIRLPQQEGQETCGEERLAPPNNQQAAESGYLKRTEAQKKMPSAYSSLCSYVASIAAEVGFEPESEILRIPSTRNSCIIGRNRKISTKMGLYQKAQFVTELVERELKTDVTSIAKDWIERASALMKKPSSGH